MGTNFAEGECCGNMKEYSISYRLSITLVVRIFTFYTTLELLTVSQGTHSSKQSIGQGQSGKTEEISCKR